jgi:hypothetical protein
MQPIATYTISTCLPPQPRVTQVTFATCFLHDSVEQVATRNNLLRRLHRGSDDRFVSGHGDAFADRRHSSDGRRAHRVDKEPTISRPTCHRRLMLSRRAGTTACVVDSVLLAACALCVRKCACRVFSRKASQPRVPRCAVSHPARYPNGVCYLRALAAEDWPRRRHRRSCPCLVGTTMRTLHARATRSSGSAIEYSHGSLGVSADMGHSVHSWGCSKYSKRG